MNFIALENNGGGNTFACAKSLDPKCYDGPFDPNQADHPIDNNCFASSVASEAANATSSKSPPAPVFASGGLPGPVAVAATPVDQNMGWVAIGAACGGLLLSGLAFACFMKADRRKGREVTTGASGVLSVEEGEGEDVELREARA